MNTISNQDASESDFIDGKIEKKGYRTRWCRRVKKIPNHPFNQGIHMDTHHIISAEAVKISKLGDVLVLKGYDINVLANLVGFPGTLPGACQLHCQLHRGDHQYARPEEKPYHDYVSSVLTHTEIKASILSCDRKTKATKHAAAIHDILDGIGVSVLKKINKIRTKQDRQIYSLPLTKISHYFVPKGLGCCNQHDINQAEELPAPCQSGRLHYQTTQRSGIDKRYQHANVRGNTKTITFTGTTWVPKVGQ